MAFLGNEAGKFKSSDKKTHDAARVLEKRAMSKDGQAVIEAFAALQSTCLACHQNYRSAIQTHLSSQ